MPVYQRRPTLIEAVRWFPPGDERHQPHQAVERGPREDHPWGLMTASGFACIQPGDWIIRSTTGEHYPCNPDVFAATFEAV